MEFTGGAVDVSVIIACRNAANYLDACFESIISQTVLARIPRRARVEVCIHDDNSTDASAATITRWTPRFAAAGVRVTRTRSSPAGPHGRGAGYARNRAIEASAGAFLCIQDADDVMLPRRLEAQLAACGFRFGAADGGAGGGENANADGGAAGAGGGAGAGAGGVGGAGAAAGGDADGDGDGADADADGGRAGGLLVGARFRRDPPGATRHYAAWCNALAPRALYLQQYRECTLVQPTWLMRRAVYDAVGGYPENDMAPPATTEPTRAADTATADASGAGGAGGASSGSAVKAPLPVPEDLVFFLRHLERGGRLRRVDEELLVYRHTPGASLSARFPRRHLLRTRLRFFERRVLDPRGPREGGGAWCEGFTIWGAGRDGRNFYNDLAPRYRATVRAFCDVDANKIGRDYVTQYRVADEAAAAAAAANDDAPKAGTAAADDGNAAADAAGAVGDDAAAASASQKKKRRKKKGAKGGGKKAKGPVVRVPVVHFRDAAPPIVCCVAMGRTAGAFEANVASLGLREGRDYFHFN